MDSEEEKAIALHSAGATVRHQSPVHALPTPQNKEEMTQETRDKWVIPFYIKSITETLPDFTSLCREATPEMTYHLLGELNWRPRVVGARIVGVHLYPEFQQPIAHLLLKSEVCCVGYEYCLTLAAFGNEAAAETLCSYLDHYLSRPDLWFDQNAAMGTLQYLDEQLGSHRIDQFMEPWQKFISNKPNWSFNKISRFCRKGVATLKYIRLLVDNS